MDTQRHARGIEDGGIRLDDEDEHPLQNSRFLKGESPGTWITKQRNEVEGGVRSVQGEEKGRLENRAAGSIAAVIPWT